MADAKIAEDRLPWLETPLLAISRPRTPARRARAPLLLLLGLFLTTAVAVTAYLAGRSLGPVAATAPEASVRATLPVAAPRAPTPAPAPLPAAPIAPRAPVVMTPAPAVAAPVRARPPEPHITWSAPKRVANARSSVRRHVAGRSGLPRYRWPAPFAAAPSGRVVQLGTYYTGHQTNAAWLRLRRAYPYLTTLPRKVIVTPRRAGRPRYYRLRIGTRSAVEARALCDTLNRMGRGCIVV
jgi:hypothetical protein